MERVEVRGVESAEHGDLPEERVPLTPQPGQNLTEEVHVGDARSYGADHLAAVLRPVSIAMIASSLVVWIVRDKEQDAAIQSGLNVYLVYGSSGGSEGSGGQSTGEEIGQALINALVIVCVVAVMTFGMVACYYFRCYRAMVAYLLLAMTMLLGYSGGFVVYSALVRYEVTADWVSLAFIMWNFALGGTVSIFWQKGIPRPITQGYLIAVSVIMAWILTKFPEWTTWALLVMLALYDLCAVLTPCGPLRWLIQLASERRAPIPGLLYEAEVEERDEAGRRVAPAAGAPAHHRTPYGERDTLVTERGVDGARRREGGGDPPATVTTGIALGGFGMGMTGDEGETKEEGDEGGGDGSGSGGSGGEVDRAPQVPDYGSGADDDSTSGGGDDMDDEDQAASIKLGLGDFVFYSVLVSRAALAGFSTFASCFVSILMGLSSTLLLLALFQRALPALPISIFLGVFFFFVTYLVIVPAQQSVILHGAIV